MCRRNGNTETTFVNEWNYLKPSEMFSRCPMPVLQDAKARGSLPLLIMKIKFPAVYIPQSTTHSRLKISCHSWTIVEIRSLFCWPAGQWWTNMTLLFSKGSADSKSRSPFPRCSILHVVLTRKHHPPTKAAAVPVYDMTKASQIKWRMTKGREKRRMFHSSISRELLCLPVWAYYSMEGKAQQQHQAQ